MQQAIVRYGVQASSEPAPVEVYTEPDGTWARLRKDIRKDTLESGGLEAEAWVYDEACFPTTLGPASLQARFDELWEEAVEAAMGEDERMERLRAQVLFTALMTDTEV